MAAFPAVHPEERVRTLQVAETCLPEPRASRKPEFYESTVRGQLGGQFQKVTRA